MGMREDIDNRPLVSYLVRMNVDKKYFSVMYCFGAKKLKPNGFSYILILLNFLWHLKDVLGGYLVLLYVGQFL